MRVRDDSDDAKVVEARERAPVFVTRARVRCGEERWAAATAAVAAAAAATTGDGDGESAKFLLQNAAAARVRGIMTRRARRVAVI